jgi:mono/diheme cytochrome c family protein
MPVFLPVIFPNLPSMIKTFVNISLLCVAIMSFTGCYYDVEDELYPDNNASCDTTAVNFAVVKPIFDAKCVGCHGGASPSAGIKLDTYIDTKAYLDGSASRLVSSVKHDGNASNMPQGQPKLGVCDISKISAWVAAGYPEN